MMSRLRPLEKITKTSDVPFHESARKRRVLENAEQDLTQIQTKAKKAAERQKSRSLGYLGLALLASLAALLGKARTLAVKKAARLPGELKRILLSLGYLPLVSWLPWLPCLAWPGFWLSSRRHGCRGRERGLAGIHSSGSRFAFFAPCVAAKVHFFPKCNS